MRMKAAVLTADMDSGWRRLPTANDLAQKWTQGVGDGDGDWWDELLIQTDTDYWIGPFTTAPISSEMNNLNYSPPDASNVKLVARLSGAGGAPLVKFQVKEDAITRYPSSDFQSQTTWTTHAISANLSSITDWSNNIKLMVSSTLGVEQVDVAYYYMEPGT